MYMSDIQGSKSRARRQHQTNMVLLSCSSTKLRPNSEIVNNDFEEYKMESPNFIMMELVDAHCSYEDVFRVIESA